MNLPQRKGRRLSKQRHPSSTDVPRETSATTPSYPIASVDSALRLIALVVERRRIHLAEAARELGVARSTAHRLMQMLQYRGFVTRDDATKAFAPGPTLMNLGMEAVRNLDVQALARPHLEQLATTVGETIHLHVFRGTELMCIESIESPQVLHVGGRQGMTLSSHSSAAGRALLALLPGEELHRLYPRSRLPEVPSAKLRTRSELEEELARVRERGYAVQSDETEPGISGIGTAVADRVGRPALGLTVALPTARLVSAEIPRIAAAARRCAQAIQSALPT